MVPNDEVISVTDLNRIITEPDWSGDDISSARVYLRSVRESLRFILEGDLHSAEIVSIVLPTVNYCELILLSRHIDTRTSGTIRILLKMIKSQLDDVRDLLKLQVDQLPEQREEESHRKVRLKISDEALLARFERTDGRSLQDIRSDLEGRE